MQHKTTNCPFEAMLTLHKQECLQIKLIITGVSVAS